MAQPSVDPRIMIGQLALVEDLASALPLENTAVHVQITGPLASVSVTQHFGNPLQEPAELDYLFPLPSEAAVTGFEIQIGKRTVYGDLQEAETARQAYETAREAGKRTGLLEQRRTNLFAVRLANVQPGEKLKAVMHYQERLKFEDDSYEYVFPMGLTPKFDDPQHPEEGKGVHAPLAGVDEKIGPVEITVAADAGVKLESEPASPSHPLEVTRIDERRFQAKLAGTHLPDHDFVLRYALSGPQVSAAAWVSADADNETFLAMLVPPRLEDEVQPAPREFIFVLDRSGSMSGQPIAQARNALRACLRALGQQDTFRILLFDNQLEWYKSEPAAITQAEVEQADSYLAAVNGRGGTEIIRAIEAALNLTPDPGRLRYVVFLTDGAVSAEDRALDQIRKMIGGARLFTFGIGPSVNRALLSRMAGLGRGRAEFLQLDEDIEGAIIRFQDSVSFPMVTDLKVEWENAKAWDIYPAQLSDLYAGQTLALSGRMTRTKRGPARLVLKGRRDGQPMELKVDLPAAAGQEPVITRVWAQARMADLLEQMATTPGNSERLRAELVGLALAHNLVSPYTSFVAIDQEQTSGGAPRVIHVALPLPKGLSREGFEAAAPPPGYGMPPSPMMPTPLASTKSGPGGVVRNLLSRFEAGPASRAKTASFGGRAFAEKDSMAQPPAPEAPSFSDRESGLRWLARTQDVDGSWQGDVERTAAALLAFLRAGHTPRSGSFRQLMRRGVQWLSAAQPVGLGAFLRAQVLAELAARSADEKDRSAAQAARAGLPAPAGSLQEAALGAGVTVPPAIRSLEDLRLAGIRGERMALSSLPPELLAGEQADLARTWAISIL